ncbi:unnamed protein product, partial [Polarella glacialis]
MLSLEPRAPCPVGNIVQREKKDALRCTTASIGAAGRRREWREALALLRSLAAGLRPDGILFSATAAACSSAQQWSTSLALLQETRQLQLLPAQALHAPVLSACPSWPQAVLLLSEFQRQSSSSKSLVEARYGTEAYSIVITACGGGRRWDLASHLLLTQMPLNSVTPDTVACNCALTACGGRWARALWLLSSAWKLRCEPSVVTVASAASSCAAASGNSWRQSLSILAAARQAGLRLNVVAQNAGGHSVEHSGHWELALQLMETMKGNSQRPDLVSFGSLVSAASRGTHWEASLSALAAHGTQGLATGVLPFNAAISACGGSGWMWCLQLLASLSVRGLQRSLISYNSAMSGCRSGRWRLSILLLAGARAESIKLDVITFNAAVSACQNGDQWSHALQVLRSMHCQRLEGNAVSQNALMAACASDKGGRWDLSLHLLEEMRQTSLPWDSVSCNSATNACSRGFQWVSALNFLRVAMSKSFASELLMGYNSVASAGSKASQWQLALDLLRSSHSIWLRPSLVTLNAAAAACAAGGRWGVVLALLVHARLKLHCKPDLSTFRSALASCSAVAVWRQSLALFRDLQAGEHSPDPPVLAAVAESCSSAGRLLQARHFFELLQKAATGVLGPADSCEDRRRPMSKRTTDEKILLVELSAADARLAQQNAPACTGRSLAASEKFSADMPPAPNTLLDMLVSSYVRDGVSCRRAALDPALQLTQPRSALLKDASLKSPSLRYFANKSALLLGSSVFGILAVQLRLRRRAGHRQRASRVARQGFPVRGGVSRWLLASRGTPAQE